MIGKESIGRNDRLGGASDYLEKVLDFHFKLHGRRPWPPGPEVDGKSTSN
jgi:hypothetical protein